MLNNNNAIRAMFFRSNISETLVQEVRTVFASGRTRVVEWRRQQLKSMLLLLDENRDQITEVLHKDLRKHKVESIIMEIDFIRVELVEALDHLDKWTAPQKVSRSLITMMDDAFIQSEPYGVALILGAWNYPIQLTFGPMIGAIAAGNCIILKPSEIAPHAAQFLEEVIPRYFDQECIKVVNGGVPETTELLKERFDYIFYTGNPQVAKIIYEAAAQYLTPVTLELGGKSPVFIDDTADLSIVAKRLMWGKFTNCGQTCIAADYILCTPTVQDRLVEKCKKVLKEFYGENPQESESFGRIVNDRHFKRILALLKSSGTIAVGGKTDEMSKYIEPTIIVNVQPTDAIMQEEIFGPILPIMTIADAEEAINFINSREKPLVFYIFSKDKKVINRLMSSTSSGDVCVNDTLLHCSVIGLPFGGVGTSGLGAYHGKFSFDAFSHKKGCLVRAQTMEKVNEFRYPPYTDTKLNVMSWILKKNPKSDRRWFLVSLPFILIGIILGMLLKWVFFEMGKDEGNGES